MTEPFHGVVVVDKPVGPTSFDIVRQARRATGVRKVGHGGTLDPLASGVLPICFGEATKLAQFLLDADKEYEATVGFGVETDTFDAQGAITARSDAGHVTADQVERALLGFVGEQQQVPPMYSALKRAGRPLYDYARAGETVERAARTVHFHTLELRDFTASAIHGDAPEPDSDGPRARLFIRCSKGTYVRSLAHDLGRVLGVGAHLTALRRTRSGAFGIAHAIAPEALGSPPLPVVSLADALSHLAAVTVSDDVVQTLVRGQPISWEVATLPRSVASHESTGPIRILGPMGTLVAVAHRAGEGERIRTIRVFQPQ
jgi:tRNA pseudouridine55 synthase